MSTTHQMLFQDARELSNIASESIDLVVTSPPYPMVAMWDEAFGEINPAIELALNNQIPNRAYTLMHETLNEVWKEIYRILKFGGFACVNIGDATRSIGDGFRLYPNHATVTENLLSHGFSSLPGILWRKQTNAPNKFMGSGMLPAGAYATLEHEHILIVRKGKKRKFISAEERNLRYKSAIFWEERNVWFSDIWTDLKGASQKAFANASRDRNAAFPFELAYRLVSMYSIKNDVVLDPFAGTGTTMAAASVAGRNSIGVEIVPCFREAMQARIENIHFANQYQSQRLANHHRFIDESARKNQPLKHQNEFHRFSVKTAQERQIIIELIENVEKKSSHTFQVNYCTQPSLNSLVSIEKQHYGL